MILTQDILRLLTVKALRGRTFVGSRVFDSPAQAADIKLDADREPYIGVFTDDADIDPLELSMATGQATVWLLIEVAVSDVYQMTTNPGDRDPSDPDIDQVPADTLVRDLAETDEALELQVGLICRQVGQALFSADNPWAEFWRKMTIRDRSKIEVRRGGPGHDPDKAPAVRYASRVIRMQLRTIAEPLFRTGELPAFWNQLLTAFEADAEMGAIGKILRAHIVSDNDLSHWVEQWSLLNISREGTMAAGIAPHAADTITHSNLDDPAIAVKITTTDEAGGHPAVIEPAPPPDPDP